MRRLLISGAGRAAMACIRQLSTLKHQFLITVLRCPGSGESENEEGWDAQALERLGVDLRAGCVEAIDRYANVVRGCDGSRTTFDTLILAGESSNPALARAAGLDVRTGVVINDFLQTSDARVYALGGGTELRGVFYDGVGNDPQVVEEQARVLTAHLAGYTPAPFAAHSGSAAGLASLTEAVNTSGASPAASAESGRRSAAQTPEPKDPPVLAGVV